MTTENYISSMLKLTWTPFETVDASLESIIFSFTDHGNLHWKTTKTDIPEFLKRKLAAVSRKCPNLKKKWMVPNGSRSVHASNI